MAWIERVSLNLFRQPRVRQFGAGAVAVIDADATRVAIRLVRPIGGPVNAELQVVHVGGSFPSNVSSVMVVDSTTPADEMDVQMYGDLVTGAFLLRVNPNPVGTFVSVIEITGR